MWPGHLDCTRGAGPEHWLDVPWNCSGWSPAEVFQGVGRGAGCSCQGGKACGLGRSTSSLSSVFSSLAPDGVGIIVRAQMGHGHCERSLQGRGPQESGGHWAAETSALRGHSFCSSFQVRSWGEAPRQDQAVTGGEIKGAFQGRDLMREETEKREENERGESSNHQLWEQRQPFHTASETGKAALASKVSATPLGLWPSKEGSVCLCV